MMRLPKVLPLQRPTLTPPEVVTTSSDPHVPIRTCVGCRRRASRSDLRRVVLDDAGRPVESSTAPGRGAWVCGAVCIAAGIRNGGFERAWRRRVAADVLAGWGEGAHDDDEAKGLT
jgi:predicted RNA-binding protein YlxR (DUF448 family)